VVYSEPPWPGAGCELEGSDRHGLEGPDPAAGAAAAAAMSASARRRWRAFSRRLLPPRLLKHQIAWRNWRRGEPEIRLLGTLVPPGRPAADIGAHLGAYTYFLRRLAPEVHAFEPQAACARFLRAAYDHRVRVHECALADYEGRAPLTAGGQAARLAAGAAGAADRVAVTRLDAFALANLGFAKIDAEGAESAILAGGRATLARCRPVLLVEIEQRHLARPIAEVFEQILALGYCGEFLLDGALQPLARFSLAGLQTARLQGDRRAPYVNNFIFRPR